MTDDLRTLNFRGTKTARCPHCRETSFKPQSNGSRVIIDIDGPFRLLFRKFKCFKCDRYFSDVGDIPYKYQGRYSKALYRLAITLHDRGNGDTLEDTSRKIQRQFGVRIPPTTLHDWVTEELEI